jgi:NAD(P)-dependent dehydrogenase (short-subunit alcohol dehydrogenase family)
VSWAPPRLDGRISLVTGATRGIGTGVALVLGEAGATVYVTGRTTVDEIAAEVTARGGLGIPVRTDHADDSQVEALFERIDRGPAAWTSSSATPGADTPTTPGARSARRCGSNRSCAGRRCSSRGSELS